MYSSSKRKWNTIVLLLLIVLKTCQISDWSSSVFSKLFYEETYKIIGVEDRKEMTKHKLKMQGKLLL